MTTKHDSEVKGFFGTDGIRTKFGEFPLTNQGLVKLGLSIGAWAQEKYGNNINILIGHDTRISGPQIKHCICLGLLEDLNGQINIYDAKIIPTPAIVKIINQNSYNFNFGIIITASHNPYQDNGIKIVDSKTGKLSKIDEDRITEIFYDQTTENKYLEIKKFELENHESRCEHDLKHENELKNKNESNHEHESKCENIAFLKNIKDFYEQANIEYITTVVNNFDKNFLKDLTIALDCANGATYNVASEIFTKLGANVIAIANNPDGKNINKDCGSTHPENLQKLILDHNKQDNNKKIDIGFAFDGDGDRIAAVSYAGEIKDGDDILCILSTHPKYNNQKAVVGTIMTNLGLELCLKSKNKELLRTNVGDKHVVKEILDKGLILGGEQSGHIVINDFLSCGDGIYAALKTIEAIKANNNWTLDSFARTPQITINIKVKHKHDLAEEKYQNIINKHKNELNCPELNESKQDSSKFSESGATVTNNSGLNTSRQNISDNISGRIIVRYSGTENLLRVMTECSDSNLAKKVCSNLAAELEKELNK